jgi:hypothetical protein
VATAVFLTKTAETATHVSYRFGPTAESQVDELTISTQTGETTGTTDRAGWVGGWIRREHERTGRWVERGSIAT